MIEIKNINKKFGNKVVLNSINLKLVSSIYGLIGVNGVGKSTLLNLLASVEKIDTGDILFNSESIFSNLNHWKESLGYIPEHPNLFNKLTVIEHIKLSLKLYGKKLDKEEIKYYLNLFNIVDYQNYFTDECSQGTQKKLSIILGFIHEPKVLILDEPFNSLDTQSTIALKKLILDYSKKSGTTIIITSHMLDTLEKITQQIILLNNGEAVLKSKNDILNSYSDLEEYYMEVIK